MSDSAILELINKRFGTRERIIERAFKNSESFRAMCRDYSECDRALRRCRESTSRAAVIREVEYAQLLLELAVEIEARLEAVESVPDTHASRGPASEADH